MCTASNHAVCCVACTAPTHARARVVHRTRGGVGVVARRLSVVCVCAAGGRRQITARVSGGLCFKPATGAFFSWHAHASVHIYVCITSLCIIPAKMSGRAHCVWQCACCCWQPDTPCVTLPVGVWLLCLVSRLAGQQQAFCKSFV